MRRLLLGGLLMWLVSPRCADADADLPRDYRQLGVKAARLASAAAKAHGERLFGEHCALCQR